MNPDNRIHRMISYLIEQMEKQYVKSDKKTLYFKREFEYEELKHHILPWWRFGKSSEIYTVRSLIRGLWKDISENENTVGEFKIVIGDSELGKIRDAYFSGKYQERNLLVTLVSLSVVVGAFVGAFQVGLTYYLDRKSQTIEIQEQLLQKQDKDLQLLQQNTVTMKGQMDSLKRSNDSLKRLLQKPIKYKKPKK